jgi:hypothetical protein
MFVKTLRKTLVVLVLLALATGLGGCRKKQVTPTPTPHGQTMPSRQSLPLAGEGNSPLPTPAIQSSPVGP